MLAVRFPKNAEPERGVGAAEELVAADGVIDIVIGEVKSRGQQLQFNEALRTEGQPTLVPPRPGDFWLYMALLSAPGAPP